MIVLLTVVALALQESEATIHGRVTESTGTAILGTTVTVSNPALLRVPIVAMTNADGEYRITGLAPGDYDVEFSREGFGTQKERLTSAAASASRVTILYPLYVTIVGRVTDLKVRDADAADRKSTRLNSSHSQISYAVFCLKKKNKKKN